MGGDRSVDVDRRQQSEDVGLQDSHEGFKQDEYQTQPQGDHTQPLNPAAGRWWPGSTGLAGCVQKPCWPKDVVSKSLAA